MQFSTMSFRIRKRGQPNMHCVIHDFQFLNIVLTNELVVSQLFLDFSLKVDGNTYIVF